MIKKFYNMKKKIFCTRCPQSAVSGCKLNLSREKKFIGVSATRSWEKTRSFKGVKGKKPQREA